MGLFGGGNSSNTSNTTNNAFDQRQVTDASGGGLVGSGNTLDSSTSFATSNSGNTTSTSQFTTSNSGNTTTSVTALDGGAIGQAFSGIRQTTADAFGFGTDALGFGSKALDGAFGFGKASITGSLNAVRDALDFAKSAEQRSYTASSDAFASAIDKVTSSMTQALGFAGKQTSTALDSLNTTASRLDSAYADAKGQGSMTPYLLMAAVAGALFIAYKVAR